MAKGRAVEPSYPPDLYLAVHSGNPGDVDFYRRACAAAEHVLELGAGAGRVACALVADGKRVVAVERDAQLMARAPHCGATFLQRDMRTLRLQHVFDRVLIPYNGIYCLLTEDDVVRCLSRARAHLHDEGLVVFDGWAADRFHEESDRRWRSDPFGKVKAVHARGRTWDVWERSEWSPETQRIDAHYRHIPRDGGEPVDGRIPQRYLRSAEVPSLLERAGLEPVALLGGFDQAAFDRDSDHLIVVAAPA